MNQLVNVTLQLNHVRLTAFRSHVRNLEHWAARTLVYAVDFPSVDHSAATLLMLQNGGDLDQVSLSLLLPEWVLNDYEIEAQRQSLALDAILSDVLNVHLLLFLICADSSLSTFIKPDPANDQKFALQVK